MYLCARVAPVQKLLWRIKVGFKKSTTTVGKKKCFDGSSS